MPSLSPPADANVSGSVHEWKCIVLNPIANLSAELNCLTKDRKPKNINKLFEVLKKGLQAITKEFLHQLIESMPLQCKAVIKSKGMPTKY